MSPSFPAPGMCTFLTSLMSSSIEQVTCPLQTDALEKRLALNDPGRRIAGIPQASTVTSDLCTRVLADLSRAEQMIRKALAISEAEGCREGVARHSGNLGILYKSLGDLSRAEEMYRKSIAVNEALRRERGSGKTVRQPRNALCGHG